MIDLLFQSSGKNRQIKILLNVIVLQTSTNSGFEAVPKTVISLCIGIQLAVLNNYSLRGGW